MNTLLRHQSDAAPTTCLAVELPVMAYPDIHALQLEMVAARHDGPLDRDGVLLLEHRPVFTIGRHGDTAHLIVDSHFLAEREIPVVRVERGGQITFHGPGQLVAYPVIDLKAAGTSIKAHMNHLEEVMIRTAADFNVRAVRNPINPGIWVGGRKLGSIGVAVRHGIAFHGLALNVNLDLAPFTWINPCGLEGIRMTSLEIETRAPVSMETVRMRMWRHLVEVVGIHPEFIGLSDLRGRLVKRAGRPVSRSASAPLCLSDSQVKDRPVQPVKREHNRNKTSATRTGKPEWLRRRLPSGPAHERVRNLIRTQGLHTVCQQARCPNQFECFSRQTATFLILGDRCTRNCRFCNVLPGPKQLPDPDEPRRVAAAARKLKLKYVVITSVTRDDVPDGGAALFAETIHQIRRAIDDVRVEVLIPDFQGDPDALATVLDARPDVLNHNIETVPRLYAIARPQAEYDRSLTLLRRVADHPTGIPPKSGLMLGLGESNPEIRECLGDLLTAGCRLLTLGQYLQPTREHIPVARYVPPEEFDIWKKTALEMGFSHVASGPFVRSSYHAKELFSETPSVQCASGQKP